MLIARISKYMYRYKIAEKNVQLDRCNAIQCNNPKFWNRHAWANSVEPDLTPLSAASDLGTLFATHPTALETLTTPGKLSQVPLRRYWLNSCDRYPELPMMVKN